ncbi:MAG: chromate transporter, partial [Acutalibacteraceae bacterium]|nr:chromate transporter [Acutalibacteraceae bacterium]
LYEMSDKTGWFTHADLANMIAVSESTPGPIGVNMATYVGYITGMNAGGTALAFLGALTATIGLITPSVIVIMLVAAVLKKFSENHYVNSAFYGLRPASTALIAAAGITVVITNLLPINDIIEKGVLAVNWQGLILAAALWVLMNKIKFTKKLHPIVFIGISAAVGIIFSMK